MADSRIPSGRLGRLARLAMTGVKMGAGAMFDRDGQGSAKQAAEVLGTLRGLAAKVGQMASYVDGIVPEGKRDAYETALKSLRAAAPTSSAEQIRSVVEEELQAPIDQLFAEWIDVPIASASIGQVHRATLHDGNIVAVKVQHPGIAKAVESDLSNAGILEGIANVAGGKRMNAKGVFDAIRSRFREELDYTLEAERSRQFAAIHQCDARIHIPNVIPSHSALRVLTTEFVEGLDFDAACATESAARRAYCETLWAFTFRGTLLGGMFNADPHPGNYLFHADGRITFFDFGCVQTLSEMRRKTAMRMHRAALSNDEAGFRSAVTDMIDAKPGRLEELSAAYTRLCFSPLFSSPFRFERPWVADLVGKMGEMAHAARKLPIEEVFALPSEMVFMNRLQFGFYSVLARFDVEVDFAAVETAFLASAEPTKQMAE